MPSDIKRSAYQETTAHFLREIWGHQPPGLVQIVAVNDGKSNGRKEYWLHSTDDGHLSRIIARHPWDDFYFTIATFNEPLRKRASAITPRLVWADVREVDTGAFSDRDGSANPTPWRMWKVSDDAYQALWLAPEGATLRQIEMLCEGMGCDKDVRKWKVTRLLACPPPVLDARALIRKYSIPVNMLMGHCEAGNRAKVCFNIAVRCIENGCTYDQTRMIVAASGAFISKANEQGDRWGERELERLPSRASAVLERQRLRA